MSYYRVCPLCGATLDPGERCDCDTDAEPDGDDETTDAAQLARLQKAYISHLKRRGAKRLLWLERAIDTVQARIMCRQRMEPSLTR